MQKFLNYLLAVLIILPCYLTANIDRFNVSAIKMHQNEKVSTTRQPPSSFTGTRSTSAGTQSPFLLNLFVKMWQTTNDWIAQLAQNYDCKSNNPLLIDGIRIKRQAPEAPEPEDFTTGPPSTQNPVIPVETTVGVIEENQESVIESSVTTEVTAVPSSATPRTTFVTRSTRRTTPPIISLSTQQRTQSTRPLTAIPIAVTNSETDPTSIITTANLPESIATSFQQSELTTVPETTISAPAQAETPSATQEGTIAPVDISTASATEASSSLESTGQINVQQSSVTSIIEINAPTQAQLTTPSEPDASSATQAETTVSPNSETTSNSQLASVSSTEIEPTNPPNTNTSQTTDANVPSSPEITSPPNSAITDSSAENITPSTIFSQPNLTTTGQDGITPSPEPPITPSPPPQLNVTSSQSTKEITKAPTSSTVLQQTQTTIHPASIEIFPQSPQSLPTNPDTFTQKNSGNLGQSTAEIPFQNTTTTTRLKTPTFTTMPPIITTTTATIPSNNPAPSVPSSEQPEELPTENSHINLEISYPSMEDPRINLEVAIPSNEKAQINLELEINPPDSDEDIRSSSDNINPRIGNSFDQPDINPEGQLSPNPIEAQQNAFLYNISPPFWQPHQFNPPNGFLPPQIPPTTTGQKIQCPHPYLEYVPVPNPQLPGSPPYPYHLGHHFSSTSIQYPNLQPVIFYSDQPEDQSARVPNINSYTICVLPSDGPPITTTTTTIGQNPRNFPPNYFIPPTNPRDYRPAV